MLDCRKFDELKKQTNKNEKKKSQAETKPSKINLYFHLASSSLNCCILFTVLQSSVTDSIYDSGMICMNINSPFFAHVLWLVLVTGSNPIMETGFYKAMWTLYVNNLGCFFPSSLWQRQMYFIYLTFISSWPFYSKKEIYVL